jgi:hypothetical protein
VKKTHRRHLRRAVQIFDLEDEYARERGVRGGHPRPIGRISFRLVGQLINDTRQEFDEPLKLITLGNPSGYHLFFGMVKPRNGATSGTRLANGRYVLSVESDFYQKAEVTVDIPMPDPKVPVRLDLSPGYAYPFPHTHSVSMVPILQGDVGCDKSAARGGRGPSLLRGGLFRVDGRGIANAAIRILGSPHARFRLTAKSIEDLGSAGVPDNILDKLAGLKDQEIVGEADYFDQLRALLGDADANAFRSIILRHAQLDTYRTDDSGQWMLVFPDAQPTGTITVRFDLPDDVTEDVANVCVIRGHVTSLNQTALRGWVLNEAGVGIQGATIRVDSFPGESTTAEDGSWFYYFGLNQPVASVSTVDVNVELPDGRTRTRPDVPIEQRATTVVPTVRFL